MQQTFLTYLHGGITQSGIIVVPASAEFETGKDYYTCKITCESTEHCSDVFVYHITSQNGNLPSMVLGGHANANGPWGCPFFGSWGTFACYGASRSNMDSNNFDVQLFSHTGADAFSSGRLIGDYMISAGGFTETESGIDTITNEADFPIFMGVPTRIGDNPDYVEYRPAQDNNLLTYTTEISNQNNIQHINQAINFVQISNTIPQDKVWDIINYLKVNGTITQNKAYCFKILPDAKIALYYGDRVEGDTTPNMKLMISEYPCDVKGFYQPDTSYTTVYSVDVDYWWGHWTNYSNNDDIIGYGATNIPIYKSYEDVQRYFSGEIGIEDAVNGGDSAVQTSSIGQPLTGTDIPSITLATSGVGCFAYALSETQLKEIMETYLFTDDTNLQDTMKDALWTWGNNPIDFMIDCYYVPFSISSFYDTINANLKFGTYQFPNTTYPAIKETNGNRLTLFNTTFEGMYGDWRDYTQFSYDLFLPFIGFVSLDPQKYINKIVKCEMMFDITTHNIRYYLYVNGIITDRFDGSVGINIPLMASDTVNKAKHDRELKYGIAGDMLNVVGSGLSLEMGSKNAVGDALGGISSIISGFKKYQELGAKPTSHVEGGFSSSMNVYDVSYAYLRITERQMILPAQLNSIYGYPSYYMGALSGISGYCEVNDIQLKSNCTEYEYNEIINLLKGGIIL